MKAFLIVLCILLQSLLCFGGEDTSDAAWIREGLAPQLDNYQRATFIPHPDLEGIVLANCETHLAWWQRSLVSP